jgi:transcriptional regulator with XRE-family HTH domain
MRELGQELRNHRQATGLSGQQLAERLGWSPSKVSRIENGLLGVSQVDLVRYAAYCGVVAKDVDALLALHRDPGTRDYWMSKCTSSLLFHESTANFSVNYEPLVVPGLLQTENYARALIDRDKPWYVNLRMERQNVLRNRCFEFFIHEQALRLPVGGARVMGEQLLKLVLLAEQPGLSIRVLPASLGARSVFGGSFVIFRYASHDPLLYLEEPYFQIFLEEEEHVVKYGESVEALAQRALSPAQSKELLAVLATRFDRVASSAPGQQTADEPVRRSG